MVQEDGFTKYHGLAIKLASSLWGRWGKGLSARGITISDACQEARVYLMELAPKLDDPAYAEQQRTAYVAKTIRGQLTNWAESQVHGGQDTRERQPDRDHASKDDLLDLNDALKALDSDTQAMVMARYAGESYIDIGERFGLSAGTVSKRVHDALLVLKRLMGAKDS